MLVTENVGACKMLLYEKFTNLIFIYSFEKD